MTDEENKLWKEWVSIAYTGSLPLSKAILAADAELRKVVAAGQGVSRITAERIRQKVIEGWMPEHDAQHDGGELAFAAASYAMNKVAPSKSWEQKASDDLFPAKWHPDWDKRDKHSRERSLEIAGALIAAELDRLAELRRRAKEG